MNKSESIKELAKALALAQAEIENAEKNATNPHFKKDYADLSNVLNTIRPVFSKYGLSISQFPFSNEDNEIGVETILMHSSGEWISSTLSMPLSEMNPQKAGTIITYFRRYSAAAVAGIAQEDSDGEIKKPELKKEEPKKGLGFDDLLKALKTYLEKPDSTEVEAKEKWESKSIDFKFSAEQKKQGLDLIAEKFAKKEEVA